MLGGFNKILPDFSHNFVKLKGEIIKKEMEKIVFDTIVRNTTGQENGKRRGKPIEHCRCSFWEASTDPSIGLQDSLL